MLANSWLVLLFPLLGFLITGIGYKRLSASFCGVFASLMVFASFLYSLILFIGFKNGDSVASIVNFADWINSEKLNISFGFMIDPLSLTMMMIITGVGFLIHVFSIGYMHNDLRVNTYFSQLNLFTFSMLLLVMSSNYLLMFVGWEGVGLCSYLLIGFWYREKAFNNAARKAFIINRIGDLGFIIGLIAMFTCFHSLDFTSVFTQTLKFESGNTIITFITLMLFLGAIGKSAQIPLFTWLPDAMAGPTPVSALIHAATMVTAGVYLIARSSALFILSPVTMNLILIVGIATTLLAAFIALMQNDIKKVLAYSTISQLGYMFVALGLSAFTSSVFHLTTHAFFKALLFLAAGSVIHAYKGEQDIRKMGGIRKTLPLTYIVFFTGVLAISGIPPFSGFFSKDEILSAAYQSNIFIWLLLVIGAMLTCFYMFRLLFLVFHGSNRGDTLDIPKQKKVMTIPLVMLAILSFAGGFLNIPELFGGNFNFTNFLKSSVYGNFFKNEQLHSDQTEIILLLTVLSLSCITIYFAYHKYIIKHIIPEPDSVQRKLIPNVIYRKFYVDELYYSIIIKPYNWIADKMLPAIEKHFIDFVVNSIGVVTMAVGNRLRLIQTGNIGFYMFIMVAAIITFIAAIVWF
ncbi:MAG: NADH-quinone oxidoreductase subunit L [Bacteroidetes bacterium]|nr:NADH-quinone oxidoreductase subunit L [Bacteroidota bacterium]